VFERLARFFASHHGVIITGFLSLLLQALGSSPGKGVWPAWFGRDIAGTLGLRSMLSGGLP